MAAEMIPTNDERWSLCRQCVDGFGISVDVGRGEYRVCGELCVVGRQLSTDDGATETTAAISALTTPPTPLLCCSICGVEVEPLSAIPCVSDDESMTSSAN